MPRSEQGLTLIELLILISIAAILMTIGLPAMAGFVAENRVTAKTNLVMSHIQYARQSAVTLRSNVVACPSDDQQRCSGSNRWDSGWIIFVDRKDNRHQPERPEDILRVVPAESRLHLHSGGRNRVRFQPTGGAFGTNLTIRVCDARGQAQARAIVVSNPGRVRVRRDVGEAECAV